MENKNWSIAGLWNQELIFGREERELKKRDYAWASEIGKNYIKAWYEMCIDEFGKSKDKEVSITEIKKNLKDKYASIQKQILKDKYPAK